MAKVLEQRAPKTLPVPFDRPENIMALLRSGKTETRRVMSPQPKSKDIGVIDPYNKNFEHFTAWTPDKKMILGEGNIKNTCHWKPPHGIPGDTLWVRESMVERLGGWYYKADGRALMIHPEDREQYTAWKNGKKAKHCSSRYMPAFASRLALSVTGLRCERLWEINDEGAKAEGVRELSLQEGEPGAWWTSDRGDDTRQARSPRLAFRKLWDAIHGDSGSRWIKNPWVWVYSFKVSVYQRATKGTA